MKNKKQHANKKATTFKHTTFGISIILFFIFLFGISSIIYTDSYKMTLEDQRKSTYGAWHVGFFNTDWELDQLLKNHAMVESTGVIELFGYVINLNSTETNIIGGIGYADENIINIGNIELLDGSFPSKKSEIAIEASYLNHLGYSYELGQTITLTTTSNEKLDADVQTTSYTLCGVIKNYSSYWKTNGNILPSFFVSKNSFLTSKNQKLYAFASIKEAFVENADSLAVLGSNSTTFLKNEFTYFQYSEKKDPEFLLTIYQTIIILSSFLFLFILINTDIRQRNQSFVVMRILGATKKQIVSIYLNEKYKHFLLASFIGILCGALFPFFIFLFLKHFSTISVRYFLSMIHILEMLFILYFGMFVSMTLAIFSLFQIPLRGMPKQQQKSFKNINRQPQKVHFQNLFLLFKRIDYKQTYLSILLTFLTALFIFLLAYQTWSVHYIYKDFQTNYPEDYSFGILATNQPPTVTMSEQSLQQIKQAYGIKDVQSISVSDYLALAFSSQYDKNYASEIHRYLAEENLALPNTEICGSLIGVSNNLLSTYIKEVDSNLKVTELKENEVILYVPDYYKQKDNTLFVEEDSDSSNSDIQLISEHNICPGDTIEITINQTIKSVKVAGIIHSFDEKTPFSYNPMKPYSLICKQSIYKNLLGFEDYAYVLVYHDPKTIAYQTDVELSKLKTNLFFTNNRVERMEQSQNLLIQIILTLVLCTSVFLITTIIRFNTYSFIEKQKTERYFILHQLGMSKSSMWRTMLKHSFFVSLTGCGFAIIALLSSCFIQEGSNLLTYSDYVKPDFATYLFDIYHRFLSYTHWSFIAILSVGFFIINISILFIHDYQQITKL